MANFGVKVNGVDGPLQTGEVISDGADGIACWFIDTDYNEESFFVRHAYFLGERSLQRTEDDAQGGDRPGSMGDLEQRYVASRWNSASPTPSPTASPA